MQILTTGLTWIHHFDQQKAACFENEVCVSCASNIATLLTEDSGSLFFANPNFTNVTAPYKRSMLFGKSPQNIMWSFQISQ